MSTQVWVSSLGAVGAVCALSLSGVLMLVVRPEVLSRVLVFLIAFASGGLLGDAVLHLLPEISEGAGGFGTGAAFGLLSGILSFFVLEKMLHWHHAHLPHEEVLHPVAVTNLVGDALHNFIDGALIAGAFAVEPRVGLATAFAVAIHEIPQELGDFGILVHAGMSPRRAIAMNFLSAGAAIAGAILTLLFIPVESVEKYLLPFTAGVFIYIASTDLFPELHKEQELKTSAVQLLGLLIGIGFMAGLLWLE